MPRFFTNIRIGDELIRDPEGDALPASDAAVRLALDTLRDMRRLPHVYGEPSDWEDRAFVIADENGVTVAIIPFSSAVDEG